MPRHPIYLDDTLPMKAANDYLAENINKGVECPCCGQLAKVYKRKLNSQMARWLIWLCKKTSPNGDWVDVKDSYVRGGDYGKLVYWGLAEKRLNDDPAKRTSGLWRPTFAGVEFTMGRACVPSHAYVYNGDVIDMSDSLLTIKQALGSHFNYKELMNEKIN